MDEDKVMRKNLAHRITLLLSLIVLGSCVASTARAQGGLDQRVSELSQQIATKMSAKQKTTIAVVEFTGSQLRRSFTRSQEDHFASTLLHLSPARMDQERLQCSICVRVEALKDTSNEGQRSRYISGDDDEINPTPTHPVCHSPVWRLCNRRVQ